MSLLDLLVQQVPVADVPELIVRFLAGDECLNHCDTLEKVFTTVYRSIEGKTYLDEAHTVLHSFDGNLSAVSCGNAVSYRNGLVQSYNDNPALFVPELNLKVWYKFGKIHRDKGPALLYGRNQEVWLVLSGHEFHLQNHSQVFVKNDIVIKQI